MGSRLFWGYCRSFNHNGDNDIVRIKREIDKFIKEFTKAKECEYDERNINWIGNKYGGVLNFGDYFFNLEDIIFDMETKQETNNIFNWHDTMTDESIKDEKFVYQNYNTWCMNGNKLLEK